MILVQSCVGDAGTSDHTSRIRHSRHPGVRGPGFAFRLHFNTSRRLVSTTKQIWLSTPTSVCPTSWISVIFHNLYDRPAPLHWRHLNGPSNNIEFINILIGNFVDKSFRKSSLAMVNEWLDGWMDGALITTLLRETVQSESTLGPLAPEIIKLTDNSSIE